MILVVDVDNVLNNLTEKALMLYNQRHSRHIKLADITAYNFHECLPKEDADAIVEMFKEKELWDSLTPLVGTQKGMKRLIECGHDIYLATATHPSNFAWKVEWLKKYFPFISPARIIRIVNKGLLACDVMVDDCLGNLIASSCHRIAIDYPWNQDKRKSYVYDIHRAKNFSDVVDIINDIERKENEVWNMQ